MAPPEPDSPRLRSLAPFDAADGLGGVSKWFSEQVQPHEPALRAYLRSRYPSLGEVDDVVQDSYLRLLKARENGKIASARAYLFTIARNAALGIFRKRRVFEEVPVEELPESNAFVPAVDVGEAVSVRQELGLATEAMDRLPGRCREIVMLRTLHGFSHREIAQKLGISEQTVRVQVAKGMKRCAEFVRRRSGSRGPGGRE